ncbi:hypothetical protein TM239_32000 [Bradyrhizobium sp. TM239]|nr:hypothetical protein TM239_32000 [Bradyrhizobium sp. TM239]
MCLLLRIGLAAFGGGARPSFLFVCPAAAALLLTAGSLHFLLCALGAILDAFLSCTTALGRGAFRRFLGPFWLVSALTGRLGVGYAGREHEPDGRSR